MATQRELVLVTGGSGLVGRNLADELQFGSVDEANSKREFLFLSSKDADLTQRDQVRSLFAKHKPDHVIHLAARVGGLFANMADRDNRFYMENCKLNENVLAASFEFNVKRCISCLSTCIFPDRVEAYPLDETKTPKRSYQPIKQLHSGPPHESNRGYAMAKRQLDTLNRHYNELRGKRTDGGLFFAVIPANIYGLHDNFHLERSHVVPGLIHRAYLSFLNRQQNQQTIPLNVLGSGKAQRQFLYGRDLARLLLFALDKFHDSREPLLILCPFDQTEISIAQVAQIICRIFKEKFRVEMVAQFDLSKSDGQFRKTASSKKLYDLEPTFKFKPLAAGLRETIDWFCANYPKVRGAADS